MALSVIRHGAPLVHPRPSIQAPSSAIVLPPFTAGTSHEQTSADDGHARLASTRTRGATRKGCTGWLKRCNDGEVWRDADRGADRWGMECPWSIDVMETQRKHLAGGCWWRWKLGELFFHLHKCESPVYSIFFLLVFTEVCMLVSAESF